MPPTLIEKLVYAPKVLTRGLPFPSLPLGQRALVVLCRTHCSAKVGNCNEDQPHLPDHPVQLLQQYLIEMLLPRARTI